MAGVGRDTRAVAHRMQADGCREQSWLDEQHIIILHVRGMARFHSSPHHAYEGQGRPEQMV